MADKKVQLNDEQWSALQALREANDRRYPTDSIKVRIDYGQTDLWQWTVKAASF